MAQQLWLLRHGEAVELACAELRVDPVDEDSLAEGFDGRAALDLMAAAGADQRVLVVGHEPDFSQVVYDLTGGRGHFKKGRPPGVPLDGSRGELIALLRPRELDRLGARG